MPSIHDRYPCHVCEKTHALYLIHGTVPNLTNQLFYVCPSNGFAVRVTRADGWKPVEAQPKDALMVHGGGKEFSRRASS
jgi:hypothetical protein